MFAAVILLTGIVVILPPGLVLAQTQFGRRQANY
jgi:hypothetical protein